MGLALLGKKIGMTRILAEKGGSTPVTVIEVGPCVVTQIKTLEKDGYSAVQIGFGEVRARNSTMANIAHDHKAGTGPKRRHREFKIAAADAGQYQVGQTLSVKNLEGVMFVDVIGRSKGKGFAGVMKRHHFKGMCASHGTERKHRSPGSIGSYGSNRGFGGGLLKGKKMAGHMGDERVTVRSLDVVRLDADRNLLLVKGPIPGGKNGIVSIRPSTRLYRSKAKRLAAA
ncbi:MAG: 50S ribosomal protein L3 [Phycisphaerales bacterium]|nr:50S ribosomal protein L3 [Phycisphaerales bacterium]